MYSKKIVVALFFASLFSFKSFSQFTATWAFSTTTTNAGVLAGVQQANVVIGTASLGNALSAATYSGSGIKCQPPTLDWPTIATDGWNIDFPISPNGNVDLTLIGLTFIAKTSGSSGTNMASLSYQKDGAGAFIPFGTPQLIPGGGTNNISFGALSRKLYGNHNYVVRLYLYAAATGVTSSRSVSIKTLVYNGTSATAGTQPSVTTIGANATGKYTALATGVVTAGTLLVNQSGVVWDVATNPIPTAALTTININGPTVSGNIGVGTGGDIAGLTAGTTYNTRAYVISESLDTFYGANLSFTTSAPTIPNLTTNVATNITSIKALSGGVILDSGGVGITKKGVCWNTSTNPDTSLPTKTNDGSGNASFLSVMKILAPSTTYYVRAYASNAIGTAYGNEVSFTTLAPQPVIITVAGNSANVIPFGDVIVNNISSVKTYTLTAYSLTPATGNITITAPAGFEISLSSGNGFGSTLNVPYTAGVIAPKTIYVRFLPILYGNYSGIITHTGGGATAVNIDDVTVTGRGIQNPSDFSNTGTDFWVGYASHNLMYNSDGTTLQSNGGDQTMALYLSNNNKLQATMAYISIPGLSFKDSVLVDTNTVYQYTIPQLIGAQLYQDGKFAKGIHVTSEVPIVVYAHIYGKFVSGAGLLLPTNTWGIDYYAASFNQNTTSGSSTGSYNYFFVIANEDNTTIEITPTVNTVGGWTANPATPYTVTLNKGEVYNVFATKVGGEDVTGSRVRSLDCNKKIALFSGSGRTGIAGNCATTLSSDNLFAQVFPNAAWGNKYLTSPTQGSNNENVFRIFVKNPTTVVTVNGNTLPSTSFPASLTNNFYYEIRTDSCLKIESDKSISVTQYCESTQGCSGPVGNVSGDPEMIFISPVQQAINKATLFSPVNQQISFDYINVIIPQTGVASFILDGVNKASKFTQHLVDTSYYIATFDATDGVVYGQHSISSDVPFNAIAYGYGDATQGGSNARRESYGYNAGTFIRPISYLTSGNHYSDSIRQDIYTTCLNNDFNFGISFPYKPNSIKWDFLNNSAQLPNSNAIFIGNPTPTDSSIINGIKLFRYTLPITYTFTSTGTFSVSVTTTGFNADSCNGSKTVFFNVKVVLPPTADFNINFNGCPSDIVHFKDTSNGNGIAITKWIWHFGGSNNTPDTSIAQNPSATYPAPGTYNVTLRAINAIGCFKDTTKPFIIKPGPVVDSIVADNRGYDCVNRKIAFTVYTTANLGAVTKWYWSYSDGKKDTTTTNQDTHTFTTAGSYTVSVIVETSNGCRSTAFVLNQDIRKVVADFSFVTPKCVNDLITFTDASTGETFTTPLSTRWNWSFGDAANSVSVTQNPQFTYPTAGTFNVKLITTLVAAFDFCADTITKQITIQNKLSTPVVTLDATKTTTSSLTFNWAAIINATGYQVSVDGGIWTNPSSGATGTSQVLTGLTSSSTHSVCVKALGLCPSDTACADGKTSTSTLDIYIPNTFSPNSTKDANKKLIFCGNNIANLRFVIFNQWGEKVYETSALNPAGVSDCYAVWDGNAQGKEQPTGVYAYVATFTLTTGKMVTKKGLVNLIR